MKPTFSLLVSISLFVVTSPGKAAAADALNLDEVHQAAGNSHSLFLDAGSRIKAIDSFVRMVKIKGASGQEGAVRDVVQRSLEKYAKNLTPITNDSKAPFNLAMELPASGALSARSGILLNAHIDTIDQSTPELLAFDAATGDFYHPYEPDSEKVSSFGGDDRSAVAVIVEAIRVLEESFWARGIAHRRIVLLFTAQEERGCVGAKYLSNHRPEVFKDVQVALSIDGPLDLKSDYPKESFVAVSLEKDRTLAPYSEVLQLTSGFCARTGMHFGQTTLGLGMGDFAFFPPEAHAGLHLRSPVRGWHNKERVKVQDLINHIDLLCYLLLGLDDAIPADKR
jgi:putative aminopeptidase FrvX